MGNDFCNDTNINQDTNDNIDGENNGRRTNAILQNHKLIDPPSTSLAVKLDDLPQYCPSQQLTQIQQKINKIMKFQKSNHLKLKISKSMSPYNLLKDPYFFWRSRQVYIGQWVYDQDNQTSVPGGIGRLYTDQEILEGQIVSNDKVIEKNQNGEISQTYKNVDLQKMFIRNKQQKQFYNYKQKQKDANFQQLIKNPVITYVRPKKQNQMDIFIKLQGQGRRFSREKQLTGFFVNNELNGKGHYRFKDGNNTYEYQGIFKDGKKHGKGIQKIGKLVKYQGQFYQDKKQGSGVLTLHLSQKYILQRQKQQKQILLQEKQVNQNLKIKKVSQYIQEVKQFQQKLSNLLKQAKIQWQKPRMGNKKFESIRQDQMFIINSIKKTKFLQNYSGQFRENSFNGLGTYTWFNGKCYRGQWSNGKMQGFGQFFWPDGTYYQGQYKNDLRHGKGQMIFSFQKRFRGTFLYGLKHGYGQLITIKIQKQPKRQDNILLQPQRISIRIKGSLYQNDKQIPNAQSQFQYYFDLDIEKDILKSSQSQNLKLNLFFLKEKKKRIELIIKNLLKEKKKVQ